MIEKLPSIVIDTNILLSAVLWPRSSPSLAYRRIVTTANPIFSRSVQAEYKDVLLRSKFDRYASLPFRQAFLDAYFDRALPVNVTHVVTDCRHPKDNKFLELALSGKADLIITGDDDLASLNPWRGIPILTPTQYLALPAPNNLP